MSLMETLFAASASVVAIYFAILSLVMSLRERQEFYPKTALRFSAISLILLCIVCFLSLGYLVSQSFYAMPFEPELLTVLSGLFMGGIIFMVLSLREVLRRL